MSSIDDVLVIFFGELSEQLVRMNDALLSLDADPAGGHAQLEKFLRDAHSVKGTAANLGFEEMAGLAHWMEELLGPAHYAPGERPAREKVDTLLEALDALRGRGEALAREGMATPTGRQRLEELAQRLQSVVGTTPRKHPSPSVGVALAQPAPAAVSAAGGAESVDESMRVSYRHLREIERRVNGLRQLRGRLGGRREVTASALKQLDAFSQGAADPRLRELRRLLEGLGRGLQEDEEQLSSSIQELDGDLRTVQLAPLDSLLEGLRPGVLTHARRVGKRVSFKLAGGNLQVDRRLFNELKDPLVHLFRNAVDHGLEEPDVRRRTGKSESGTLSIQAYLSGDRIRLEIRDDGRGINLDAVRARAINRGLVSADVAAALTESEVRALLLRSGFSTAAAVTETSGRGVGLDVVANTVRQLQGTLEIQSTLGVGTAFILILPRAQVAEQVFLVDAAGRRIAVRVASVERTLRVTAAAVKHVCGQPLLRVGGHEVRLVSLAQALGLPAWEAPSEGFPVLVLKGSGGERVGVRCDRILGVQDALVRPVPEELAGLEHLAGAADLGNGRMSFVLNDECVLRAPAPAAAPLPTSDHAVTILVVDDTVTSRALHRRVLETAGYRVLTSANGLEALRVLESEMVQLVVTDLEMPELDGIEMLQRIRASPRLANTPAVLVSSLPPDSARGSLAARGLADAYVTKAAYDQGALLSTVKRLIDMKRR
ncbi:MAG: hybrid sensor histidine kinase/response regulator [Myxococcaceae bacterium]